MKTLILLRHAKAVRGEPDHGRALDQRGVADAVGAGRALQAAGLHPGASLMSDARRSRETYEGVAGVLGPSQHTAIEPALYEASPATILELIRAVPEASDCLLVVGHNPGIAELARVLAAHGPSEAITELQRRFPTAGMAVIDFSDSRWSGIKGDGTLRSFWADSDHQGD